MTLPMIVATAIVVLPNCSCVITERERWPFSRYPMFSRPVSANIRVYRLAYQESHGDLRWWFSRFHKLQKSLAVQTLAVLRNPKSCGPTLSQLLRVVHASSYESSCVLPDCHLCVVCRHAHVSADKWQVRDEVVAIFPLLQ
jgi:hypothetical protein